MSKNLGIPIAAYGRDASVGKVVAPLMAPEYDVVHVVGADPVLAAKEFNALLSGDFSKLPAPGLGSNADRPEAEKRVPLSLGCGGGIPEEEYQQLRKEVGEDRVKWVKLRREDLEAKGFTGGPPDPQMLAAIWKEKLKAQGL